jgi:hypothetical protein
MPGSLQRIRGLFRSGAGYSPLGRAASLPNPPAPAWVRPVDVFSFAAAIHPRVTGNRYDGRPYNP